MKGSIGETLTSYINGTGLLVTPLPNAVAPDKGPASLSPQPLPEISVTVGGISATIVSQAYAPGTAGVIQVTYRIPEGVVPGKNPVVVYVSNGSTTSTTIEVVPSK